MHRSVMHKPIALALALIMLIGLSACGTLPLAPAAFTQAPAATEAPQQSVDDARPAAEEEGYNPCFSSADLDASWSLETATSINFTGDSATVDGDGAVAVEGGVKISEGGTYVLSGVLTDGRVVASLDSDEPMKIVLNGVQLSCTTSAPLYLANGNVVLVLADGTQNELTDAQTYNYPDPAVEEPNACLYADDDLTILGEGTLRVNANFNNGIGSKDELKIASGTIEVKAKKNALKGNDCVLIRGGTLLLESEGDGIKSDNKKDEGMGVISIDGGTVQIISGDDALQATNAVSIAAGLVTIKAGGKRINCDGALSIAAGCLK